MKRKRLEKETMQKESSNLSFLEHLAELRVRLFKSVLAVFIGTCFSYAFVDRIFFIIIKPVGKLIFTSPADAFLARITLAIFAGLFLALPVVLFQIWQFIRLGLTEQESRYVIYFGPVSLLLFVLGGLFAYFVMIPIALHFLLSFSSETVVAMITIKNYISFLGMFILAFGITFELPLVLIFLTKMGLATPRFLAQKRRYAIVIIFIVSALITPPDVMSQLFMAFPLIVLYEIGIVVSRVTYKMGGSGHKS